MAVLKCKMCGADLNIEENQTVCECEYCGSKQTIPKVDDEKKVKLFERANRLRRNCEFDKATAVYESIVADFEEEAEAYWGLVLCKYGIEYVDDPSSGDKIPTCHRSSFDSVMDDPDFELVMEYADPVAKRVYREEAKQIEEIRKGIVEVSGKEPPYDIFICYKETDDNGERTLDSVIAQDVYDALTDKGYRVFFSRISLEDKLGTEYEPYIFAALNSAKVMLSFGTDYEYYDSVWVKNEWSRFLKLMAKDKEKHLIPCYKGIDAYDIPKEFSKLQAQDMGKVGAVQDLIRGIDKLLGKTEKTANVGHETVIQQVVSGGPNIDALLKRGYDALEDGAFDEAKTFFNDALNSNAQSADAYLGLFMAEIEAANKVTAQSKYVSRDYTDNRYWKRAKQYADSKLAETLNSWNAERNARLQREAAEARRAKEEADRKTKEAKEKSDRIAKEAEEAEKKKQELIRNLQEQLRTGNFQMTPEDQIEQERLIEAAKTARIAAQTAEDDLAETPEAQEISRLEELISSKKSQLAGLGLFKGKEKKELHEQIGAIEKNIIEAKKGISEEESAIIQLKQQAEDAQKHAEEYGNNILIIKRKSVREQLFNILGLDFSGDSVYFGSYQQGGGVRPIEWRVLERTDNSILLITKYAIARKRYHEINTNITWENCDLRKWLNKDFLNDAFSEFERSLIADTRCPADKHPKYNTSPGRETTDKIFILSITEVEKYFPFASSRLSPPTAYAVSQGAHEAFGSCCWWLRTPGRSMNFVVYVNAKGLFFIDGDLVNSDVCHNCVRPVLRINLEP